MPNSHLYNKVVQWYRWKYITFPSTRCLYATILSKGYYLWAQVFRYYFSLTHGKTIVQGTTAETTITVKYSWIIIVDIFLICQNVTQVLLKLKRYWNLNLLLWLMVVSVPWNICSTFIHFMVEGCLYFPGSLVWSIKAPTSVSCLGEWCCWWRCTMLLIFLPSVQVPPPGFLPYRLWWEVNIALYCMSLVLACYNC